MKCLILLFLLFVCFVSVCTSQQGWYKLDVPTTEILKDISFANENFGCVVGYSNCALMTTNGGATWIDLNINNKLNLINASYNSVSLINDSTILISGSGNFIVNYNI